MNADDNIVVRFAGRPFIHIVLGKAVSVEKTRLVGTSAVKCLVCCNHQADPWIPLMCPVGNALFFTDQTQQEFSELGTPVLAAITTTGPE